MKSLNDEQIQQLTKSIVKHCIIPDMNGVYDCPGFNNIEEAMAQIDRGDELINAWYYESNENIEKQVSAIYTKIRDSIIESLKEIYNV